MCVKDVWCLIHWVPFKQICKTSANSALSLTTREGEETVSVSSFVFFVPYIFVRPYYGQYCLIKCIYLANESVIVIIRQMNTNIGMN